MPVQRFLEVHESSGEFRINNWTIHPNYSRDDLGILEEDHLQIHEISSPPWFVQQIVKPGFVQRILLRSAFILKWIYGYPSIRQQTENSLLVQYHNVTRGSRSNS
eukprot:763144-Hanusia_phi.AAC.1